MTRTIRRIKASVGFQALSLANSTALPLNSTLGAGSTFHISVETQAVRYRADGSSPALTTGVLLAVGSHWLEDVPGTALKFQRSTGTSKVSVQGYKYKGSG